MSEIPLKIECPQCGKEIDGTISTYEERVHYQNVFGVNDEGELSIKRSSAPVDRDTLRRTEESVCPHCGREIPPHECYILMKEWIKSKDDDKLAEINAKRMKGD